MAIKVKDAAAAAQKFVTRAQAAAPDYANGVANAGGSWAQNTKAAADSYAAGVQQAISNNRFANGVNQNAQNKYQTRASGVGAQRFGPGVAASKDSWASGVQPYLTTIANITLPPRQPKGSPANYARVQAVGDALRQKKLQGGGQ